MSRTASVWVLLAAVGGCATAPPELAPQNPPTARGQNVSYAATVPGVQGPYGMPIPMVQPYAASPYVNDRQAKRMMSNSMPLSMMQMHGGHAALSAAGQGGYGGYGSAYPSPGEAAAMRLISAQMAGPPGAASPALMAPAGGMISPPGVPFAPGMPAPAGPAGPGGMMSPGGMAAPGATPGGVVQASFPPGAVAAVGAQTHGGGGLHFTVQRTQVRFLRPSGMRISWYTKTADGKDSYSQTPVETPGRYNFLQAAVYRLKLSNIPRRPGLEVYPTLEVVPANPNTEAFLSHSAVPLAFTDEDFEQIALGNYVVKVIYLPDPQFQDLAFTGPDEIVSTELEPGADPIAEARRRGNILLVVRMGNLDQEAPNTPSLNDVPHGHSAGFAAPPPNLPPGTMVPYVNPPLPGGPPLVPPQMPTHGPLGQLPSPGPLPQLPVPPQPGLPPMPPTSPTGFPNPPGQLPAPPTPPGAPLPPQAPQGPMTPLSPHGPGAPALPQLPGYPTTQLPPSGQVHLASGQQAETPLPPPGLGRGE